MNHLKYSKSILSHKIKSTARLWGFVDGSCDECLLFIPPGLTLHHLQPAVS